MMKQYLEIKRQYPDCILFFRMGDFYEMFFEDARTASRILEIALTSREKGEREKVPMCGVPYHAASPYIAKLLQHGYKVAICEQVEDPRAARGIVRREVVRVITPGMAVEEESLGDENNYLMALCEEEGSYALGFLDLSTGDFKGCLLEGRELLESEITKNSPREALLPAEMKAMGKYLEKLFPWMLINYLPAEYFDAQGVERFSEESPPPPLQRAAGAILRYVLETQKVEPAHIRPLEVYRTEQYLILDETTQRNLELFSPLRGSGRKGSLLGVLDRTVTAMGRRRLRQWLAYPLRDLVEIGRRLEAVASLKEAPLERDTLRELLEGVSDIERLNARLALGRANPRELVALKESLERVPEIRERLLSFGSDLLQKIAQGLDPLEEVVQKIRERIVDDPPATVTEGGIIQDGYHQELDELRSISREGKGWIAKLEAEERRRTGIPSLKVGYNQVFGYYIEVTRPNLPLVPEDYVRKQTLKGAERFITPKLKEYERKVLGAEERIKALEYELFLRLREELMAYCPRIQGLARRLSELDVLISLAQVAEENRYVRPSLTEEDRIEIKEGRHPVIEQMDLPEPFVPNDALLDQQNRILIITGPNMAGKSTYIRQVALIVIMAQMGSFVPAKEAEVGLVDRIFTRVGASDNIARGESTFMVEMRETAAILQGATPRSLVILDEIGRGTSTFDGLSIAWAVAEYLHDVKGPKVLFATHYHELTELASRLPGVKNYHIAVREWKGEVVFLRQVLPGGMSRSYGIQVARLAGLPQEVIGRAKEVLSELEKGEVRRRREELQLSLFVPQESPVIRELKRIDPDRLTPLEALELLYRWKRETEG